MNYNPTTFLVYNLLPTLDVKFNVTSTFTVQKTPSEEDEQILVPITNLEHGITQLVGESSQLIGESQAEPFSSISSHKHSVLKYRSNRRCYGNT